MLHKVYLVYLSIADLVNLSVIGANRNAKATWPGRVYHGQRSLIVELYQLLTALTPGLRKRQLTNARRSQFQCVIMTWVTLWRKCQIYLTIRISRLLPVPWGCGVPLSEWSAILGLGSISVLSMHPTAIKKFLSGLWDNNFSVCILPEAQCTTY